MDNQIIIKRLPVLALRGLTIFPNMSLHFDVGREKSIKALEAAMEAEQVIFVVAQTDIRTEEPDKKDLYEIGTIAQIKQVLKLPGNVARIQVSGIKRAKLIRIETLSPYMIGQLYEIDEPSVHLSKEKKEALIRNTQHLFENYSQMVPRMSNEIALNIIAANDPSYLSDYIGQNISLKYTDRQQILEELNPIKRIKKVMAILKEEIEILGMEQEIGEQVKERIDKNQRDYYLREQIKVIQEELGEGEDTELEANDYKDKILKLKLPEESEKKLIKESVRLAKMHYTSPEASVIRTYLDTVLELPFNKQTKDKIDIKKAQKMLDNDHYGIEKVKDRIIELLATAKLTGKLAGTIICLYGPPGVGKTSMGASIAKAMGKKFVRVSLGGARDEADIRGHRKTYIGSMPGRIINGLRLSGSKNCVMLLDEIDKMGHDMRGDPASALLEVFDTEQNKAFRDHYIEIPFDLSQVVFITTANSLETIPRPLLDRMEIIELSSYTDEEKLHITKRFLLPKQMKKYGLQKNQIKMSDDVIRQIIRGYTRESGVRSIERKIAEICRKSAKIIALGEKQTVVVLKNELQIYLGPQRYKDDKLSKKDEIGIVNGLAWTQSGGEMLEVEVNIVNGNGKIELTGNLGDVMKESAKAAISYIRSRADKLNIDKEFHTKNDIHIHFPEGAIPKDGPSAGIAMATGLISALTGKKVKKDVAMTGEITLRGRVLAIGGLREKTMAALRTGIKTVILPKENQNDMEEVDKNVAKGLNFVFCENMDEVIKTALK